MFEELLAYLRRTFMRKTADQIIAPIRDGIDQLVTAGNDWTAESVRQAKKANEALRSQEIALLEANKALRLAMKLEELLK
jgi:hypothetical protein